MKISAGLWIDHKQAVLVFVENTAEIIKHIRSGIEKSRRKSGVSIPADDVRQRELTSHLNVFYDEVAAALKCSKRILLMGPGEAKGELQKRLELVPLPGREITVETTDKMTEPQIVAKVKDYFRQQRGTFP